LTTLSRKIEISLPKKSQKKCIFLKKSPEYVTVFDKTIWYHGPKQRTSRDLGKAGKGERIMKWLLFLIGLGGLLSFQPEFSALAEDLGRLSRNPFNPESTSNPFGAGSPYRPDSINNPFGTYGSPFSPKSTNNRYATDAPKLYDNQGNYRGRLSSNPYDPDSTSNPFGRYGSRFSPDSINNPFGPGNPFSLDSPNNPYGTGWRIESSD
jgi:hypothetical protein